MAQGKYSNNDEYFSPDKTQSPSRSVKGKAGRCTRAYVLVFSVVAPNQRCVTATCVPCTRDQRDVRNAVKVLPWVANVWQKR